MTCKNRHWTDSSFTIPTSTSQWRMEAVSVFGDGKLQEHTLNAFFFTMVFKGTRLPFISTLQNTEDQRASLEPEQVRHAELSCLLTAHLGFVMTLH